MKRLLLGFGFIFLLAACNSNQPATPPVNLIQNWHIHGEDGESEWFVMSELGYEIDKITPDKEYEMVYFCSPRSLYASFPSQQDCTTGPVGSVTYGIPAGTEPNVGQSVLVTKITDTRSWCNFSGHVSTADYNTGPNGGCLISAVYNIPGHLLLPGSMPEEWYEFVKCSWETSWQDVANSVDTMPNDAPCFFFRYDNNNDLYIGGETDHLGQDINWYRDPISNDPKGALYWIDNISPGGGIGKGFPLHYMDDNNGTNPATYTDHLYLLQETEDQIGFIGNANPPLDAWKIILGYSEAASLTVNTDDCDEVRSVSYELGPLFTLATWSYEGLWSTQPNPPCPDGWPFDWDISDPDTSNWP